MSLHLPYILFIEFMLWSINITFLFAVRKLFTLMFNSKEKVSFVFQDIIFFKLIANDGKKLWTRVIIMLITFFLF